MKVLVATGATQGSRGSDSNGCIEGELVWMLEPCPYSRWAPYGDCGCGRSFSGMNSLQSTTTARVCDVPGLTRDYYEQALRACFDARGWCVCCQARPVPELVDELITLATILKEGAVVERRLDRLTVRRVPAAKKRRGKEHG